MGPTTDFKQWKRNFLNYFPLHQGHIPHPTAGHPRLGRMVRRTGAALRLHSVVSCSQREPTR
jgi:hypothetical protein